MLRSFAVLLLSLLYALNCCCQHRDEWRFQNDNDVYLLTNQDHYYTNGMELTYLHRPSAVDRTELWEFRLGQKIYNGIKRLRNTQHPVDMPFTGYLYASGSWVKYRGNKLLKLGMEVAQIGPRSYGQQAQELFHETFNFYQVEGWEYKLRNALGVDLMTQYQGLLVEDKSHTIGLSLEANARLGMHHTHVNIAVPLRIGRLREFYKSVFTNGHLVQSTSDEQRSECFFFYRPMLQWQAYNSTIQGGLFQKDPIGDLFQIKPWVLSQELGVQYQKKRLNLAFSYQFDSRLSNSMIYRHQYGKLMLGYQFGK